MLSFEILERRFLLSVSEAISVSGAPSVSEATTLATTPSGRELIDATAAQQTVVAQQTVAAQQSVAALAANDHGTLGMQVATQVTITSVRDGFWSNPATWSSGQVPRPTDDVVIGNNVTIDQGSARQVDIIAGTTTLAGNLQAYGSVIVRSSLIGTQGGIYFHVADDRLDTGNTQPGSDAALPDFHPEDVGLWELPGAHMDLEGPQVTPWLGAIGSGALEDLGHGVSQQVAFGAGNATLQTAPVGWRTGDTLLLVNEHGQSLLADLVAVHGASIQYQERKVHPTDPDLVGHQMVVVGSTTVVYPKIADLTRRIQIVGADVHEGDTHHRAFTAAMDAATVSFVNVEFRDLGPRAKLGRYPVYFQDVSGAGNQLTGSSLWQDVSDPGNRFVALAGVQGTTIANNVAYRSQGDGFFMEDGTEYGNTIAHNLSVQVTGGEELPNPDSHVTQLTHHYWLRTGNAISGNVAAGGDAVGMIILASSQPGTLAVAGTEVLGAGLFGMWTGTPNVTFNNPIAVYNSRAGFASEPAWDVDSHGATLNNPVFLFNGTSDSAYGSQVYSNDGDRTVVDGGVLAGVKGFHTHYHSSITVSNAAIDVDTLLVPTYWEQAAIFSHDQIRAALLFESAYPAPRYASPGLARIVDSQLKIGTEPVEEETADYIGSAFQNYPALPGTPIPNGIELLEPAPDSGFIRVTLLPDDERWMTNIARWTVTPLGQTPQADSFIYHRQTAWTRLAGFGGYPDGFPPGEYAVKLYTESGALVKSGFAVVRSGQVSDLTDTLDTHSVIVSRQLFYNQSAFDNNSAAISANDDHAIAIDKTAYVPGSGSATFANVSSYSKGINGIMIDISGAHGAITSSDFTFRARGSFGNNNSNGTNSGPQWQTIAATPTISIRSGAGVGGADRVEITWPNNAIQNTWLEVTVGANSDTGLASPDIFYFGNLVGNSGQGDDVDFGYTDATDQIGARSHQVSDIWDLDPANTVGIHNAIMNIYDYNRDNQVDGSDVLLARANDGELGMITIGSPPHAPATAEGRETAVASALAILSRGGEATQPSARVVNQLSAPGLNPESDLSQGPITRTLGPLAETNAARTRESLAAADRVAGALGLDDSLLDSILVDLRLA